MNKKITTEVVDVRSAKVSDWVTATGVRSML